MKKTFLFALALAVVGLMPSCVKEPDGNDETDKTRICFGNYEGMDVTTYDNINWSHYEDENYILYQAGFDLDGDDYCETGLTTKLSRNPIACLPSDPLDYYEISMLADFIQFHTSRIRKDIFYHADSIFVETDSVTLVYKYEFVTCAPMDESDILSDSYVEDILEQHGTDDVLDIDDTFRDLDYELSLYKSELVFPTMTYDDTTGVTTYFSSIYSIEECFNFPLDEAVYIGFKVVDGERERLGWIKLIIEPNANGHYCPRVLETAIQK